MKIDPTDLVPIKLPIQPGGVFYRKDADGEYSTCCIKPDEISDRTSFRTLELMHETQRLHKLGLLFYDRNKPWKAITL